MKQLKIAILSLLLSMAACPAIAQFDSGRASASIIVNNEIYPYREFSVFVLPAEHLDICVIDIDADLFTVSATSGTTDKVGGCRWIWTAPDAAGNYQISISLNSSEAITLNALVMVPGDRLVNGRLDNNVIGEYPEPLEDSPIYLPPDGFIRVSENMLGMNVSPNFRLGQFVSQDNRPFPKYIVLRERLLLKLEVLLEYLNESGIAAESLSIIRGYLTPLQNTELGGDRHSRHIYGGAATLIVDRDNDGRMDDINGDGTLDRRDGAALFDLVDELFSRPGKEYLRGGLFLHSVPGSQTTALTLDARGFRKRWENNSEFPELPQNLRPKHKREFE